MDTPLITIAITCFNAENSIEKAIKSAISQDYPNKEIIVVDDYSSDNSCKIISKYKEIKLIRHDKNKGAAAARNTIIKNANGEYIAFFDDDDESLPQRLSKQYERIKNYQYSNKVMCFTSGIRKYENGYELKLNAIGCDDNKIPYGNNFIDRYLFFGGDKNLDYGNGAPTCSLMASKSLFEEIRYFDEKLKRVEDIDFAIRAAKKGIHFIGCKDTLFIQYATDTQDKSPEKNLEAELLIVEKNKEYLKSKGRYLYAKTWPKIRCYHFQKKHIKMTLILGLLFIHHPIWVTKHILNTGVKRLKHEKNIDIQ